MKLTRRQGHILFITLMALIMSGVMSLAMGVAFAGISNGLRIWPSRWLVGFIIAWPTAYFVVPLVRRIVDVTTR